MQTDTYQLQDELVRYCRTGENEPITTKQENTFHYRRLVYNVVRDTIKKANPLFIELFGKEKFESAVKHFFAEHKCQTAQVWKLPKEFCEYYSANPLPFEHDCAFVTELLLFEWTEVEIFMMEDEESVPYVETGNKEKDFLVSNPEIRIIPLSFPIHKMKVSEITESDRGQYFVIFVRHPETKKVKYYDISLALAEILVRINDEPTKFEDLKSILIRYENSVEKQNARLEKLFDYALKQKMILGYTGSLNQ